jgi:hypothetical protein
VKTRATFHRYSWRNTMLIAMQRPDATRVAGFRAWLKLNRCVRKGERGIRIFAPMTVAERDAASDDDGNSKHRTPFRLTRVFDISETDPLPTTEPVPSSRERAGDGRQPRSPVRAAPVSVPGAPLPRQAQDLSSNPRQDHVAGRYVIAP